MDAQSFHIVDLVAEIGLDQDRPVDHRTRPDLGERDAAHPYEQPGGPAELALQDEEVAARQQGRVADVVGCAALHRERAGAGAADQERQNVAGAVEATFRDRDQGAGQRRPFGREHQRLQALVGRERMQPGRDRDRLPAREQTILAVVEAHDLMDALDPHIERAAVLGDRFGVVPAAIDEGAAVGAEDRRHLRIGDAVRPGALIDDAAAQPPALVGQGNEMRAVSRDADRRKAAEMPVRRAQHQAAAELQEPELPPQAVADVEARDRLGIDVDRDRCRGRRRLRGAVDRDHARRDDERDGDQCGDAWAEWETRAAKRRAIAHASSLLRTRGAGSAGASSSNSSASLSVMAPPSSSASTMVTARR